MSQAYNLSTQKAEAEGLLQVCGQHVLLRESLGSLGYLSRLCLRRTKQTQATNAISEVHNNAHSQTKVQTKV